MKTSIKEPSRFKFKILRSIEFHTLHKLLTLNGPEQLENGLESRSQLSKPKLTIMKFLKFLLLTIAIAWQFKNSKRIVG